MVPAVLAFRRIGHGAGNGAHALSELPAGEEGKEKMAKVSVAQLHELGEQIKRGQIPAWKVQAVFGITEIETPLDMYLALTKAAKAELVTAERLQALMEGEDEALGIFRVTVDYGLSLEQMIAVGHYDKVSSNITPERFPIRGEGKVERKLVLVHLNKVATTDEALAELDRRSLRPAWIEELLALGAARPDLQRQIPIVEIGSSFMDSDGGQCVAHLSRWGTERRLFLSRNDAHCPAHECCRFLAVRKDAA